MKTKQKQKSREASSSQGNGWFHSKADGLPGSVLQAKPSPLHGKEGGLGIRGPQASPGHGRVCVHDFVTSGKVESKGQGVRLWLRESSSREAEEKLERRGEGSTGSNPGHAEG